MDTPATSFGSKLWSGTKTVAKLPFDLLATQTPKWLYPVAFAAAASPVLAYELNKRTAIARKKIEKQQALSAIVKERLDKNSAYDPPMGLEELKSKYPYLVADPVHKWRAETGIELIHREPSKSELLRILKNWREMSPEQQTISDAQSNTLFGMGNEEYASKLLPEYEKTALMPEVVEADMFKSAAAIDTALQGQKSYNEATRPENLSGSLDRIGAMLREAKSRAKTTFTDDQQSHGFGKPVAEPSANKLLQTRD